MKKEREKIRYGIVGCGGIVSGMHLPALKQCVSAEVVALCDINKEVVERVSLENRIKKVYYSFKDIAEDKEVDVVLIALPPALNREVVLYSAKRRKHIFLEKPIAATLKDAKEIIDVCRENNVHLCINHQRRFSSCEQKARQLIKNGAIGELLHIRITFHSTQGFLEYLKDNSWRTNKENNGFWLLWGVHFTDILRFLTDDEVLHVYAEIGSIIKKVGQGEESAFALLRTVKGIIGEVQISCIHYPIDVPSSRDEKTEIYGSSGTIIYYRQEGRLELYSKKERRVFLFKLDQQGYNANMIRWSRSMHEKFLLSIFKNSNPPVTGEDAYKALEIIIAGYNAAQNKKVVEINKGL